MSCKFATRYVSLILLCCGLWAYMILPDTVYANASQPGQGDTTTIRYGKPNWTVSERKPPEGLRQGMVEIKRASAQSANKNFTEKTTFRRLAAQGSPERGRKLYTIHCYQCHGYKGEGNGPSTVYLPRPPRDFTEGLYKLKTSPPQTLRARDQDIYNSITNGLVVGGMPSWRDTLTDSQRWDLVAYIKTFSDLFDGEPNPPPIDYSAKIPFSPESVERGRIAYREFKCFECHGETGKGPAIKELKDDYGFRIWPRDLTNSKTYIGELTPEALYARVTNGIPLTPMPSFVLKADNDLLEKKRWDVVNYVMWLVIEEKKKRKIMILIFLTVTLLAGLTAYHFAKPYLRKSD